jgi:hypothetical protein
MVMGGEALWIMSFSFCVFVFLQVMGDVFVIVIYGFNRNKH